MNKTRTQQVFLNSKYGTTYNNSTTTYNSDVTFYLSRPIQRPKDSVLALRLETFVFPVSFYNINSTNNTLIIDDGGETTYTISAGYYNADTLKDEINSLLIGSNITLSYDDRALKYTFIHTANDFTVMGTSTCLTLLGFEAGDHASTTNELTSTYPINLAGQKVIYVDIQNLSINNLNGITGQRTTTLTSVPVSSSGGEFEYYENTKQSYVYLQEDTINTLRIRLYEEDQSTLINFQNQHWLMTLEFSFEKV